MKYHNYEAWNRLLCRYLFSPQNENQPATLFVDDDAIDDMYGGPGGVASLVSAVRVKLRPERDGMFVPVYQDALGWKAHGGSGFPPSIPLLACCVLAAARMAAGNVSGRGKISSSNYYDRFRELLRLGGSGGVAGYDEHIPALWKQIAWWLDEKKHGRFGQSTIPTTPAYANIGYALSQALFRQSDRQRLSEFLRAIGFRREDGLSPAELLVMFRAWAPRSALSAGAKLMGQSDEYAAQMSAILAGGAAHWDGTVRDEMGRRLAQILVRLVPRPPSLDLVAECPDSFPERAEYSGAVGGPLRLTRAAPGWYAPTALPPGQDVLANGLKLRTSDTALALQGEPIHILSLARPLNGWSSTRTIDPMEEHILLVQEAHRRDVEAYLAEFANRGWSPGARRIAGLPAGWAVYEGVRIERPPARNIRGALSSLVPALRTRARFWGGMPAPRLRAAYFTGGEPAVLVPTEGEDIRALHIRVDSTGDETTSAAGLIFLSGRDLLAGEHAVTVGPTTLGFTTLDGSGVQRPAGTGAIGHVVGDGTPGRALTYEAGPLGAEQSGVRRVAGAAVMDGAASSSSLQRPLVLVGRAGEYRLLGARIGEIIQLSAPAAPAWLQGVGLAATSFEAYAPFAVVWVLELRSSGWRARLASSLPPNLDDGVGTTAEQSEWLLPFQMDEAADGMNAINTPAIAERPRQFVSVQSDGTDLWAEYRAVVHTWLNDEL